MSNKARGDSVIGKFFIVRNAKTKEAFYPKGVSASPQLYLTNGKAEGCVKRMWDSENYEVVPVTLTETKVEEV